MAKIKKGSNSVNTVDRVMILAFCTSSDTHLIMCQFHNDLIILYCKDKNATIKSTNLLQLGEELYKQYASVPILFIFV